MDQSKARPHQVWGEPEILSCHDSSSGSASWETSSSSGRKTPQQKPKGLPKDLRRHVQKNVLHRTDSSSSQSQDSTETVGAEQPIPTERFNKGDGSSKQQTSTAPKQYVELMSRGAALHDSGTCRPCIYINMSCGCRKRTDCEYCHLPHPKAGRRRPSKRTRNRIREVMPHLGPDSAPREHNADVQQPCSGNAALPLEVQSAGGAGSSRQDGGARGRQSSRGKKGYKSASL